MVSDPATLPSYRLWGRSAPWVGAPAPSYRGGVHSLKRNKRRITLEPADLPQLRTPTSSVVGVRAARADGSTMTR